MRILAGTSGFSYPAWKGSFYPQKLPASRMLAAYASRLPTVEINASFYRVPSLATLERWRDAVPFSFRFALKGTRRITHAKRLAGVEEEIGYFHHRAAALEATLGVVLWQLPPSERKDLGKLREFLALLRGGPRAALELRHASWFGEDVLTALADAGVALCAAEDEDRETPLVATAPFGYLRLRRPDYDPAALDAWAERVLALPWKEAFVFFKHESRAPALALRFAELCTLREQGVDRTVELGASGP
jgi:uncharacterized protein YecE (DUF72 family)